jgi:hypothetical protein
MDRTDLNKDKYISKIWMAPTDLPLSKELSDAIRSGGYSQGLRLKQGTAGNCHFTAALASTLWADIAPEVSNTLTPRPSVRLFNAELHPVDVSVPYFLEQDYASLLPFDLAGEKTHWYHLISTAYINLGDQNGGRNFNELEQAPDGEDPMACLQGLASLTGLNCEYFTAPVGTDDQTELVSWLGTRQANTFAPTLLWSSGGSLAHAFSVFAFMTSFVVIRDAKGAASGETWQTLPNGAKRVGFGNGNWPTNFESPENSFGLFTITIKQLSQMLGQGWEGKKWHIGGVSQPTGIT